MQGLAAPGGCRRLAVAFLMQCLAVAGGCRRLAVACLMNGLATAGVVGGWPQLS